MEKAFSVVPAQGPLCHVSEVHGVLSKRDLPSISGAQPSATAIVYTFWEPLEYLLQTTQKKKRFSFIVLGILLDVPWLLWGAPSAQKEKVL